MSNQHDLSSEPISLATATARGMDLILKREHPMTDNERCIQLLKEVAELRSQANENLHFRRMMIHAAEMVRFAAKQLHDRTEMMRLENAPAYDAKSAGTMVAVKIGLESTAGLLDRVAGVTQAPAAAPVEPDLTMDPYDGASTEAERFSGLVH